jgi:uncharacterized membrane protein required for colicin V production
LTVLDIVILTVIAACAIYGARQGLVRELSHIVAFGLGLFLAVKLHSTAARVILYRLPSNTAALAAFLGLLLLTIAAVYLTFSYFKSAADKLKLGPADHVAGAAFGAIQGTLVCTLIIFVLVNFSSSLPASYLGRSRVASFLLDRSAAVSGIVPEGCISKVISLFSKKVEEKSHPANPGHAPPAPKPQQTGQPQLQPSLEQPLSTLPPSTIGGE